MGAFVFNAGMAGDIRQRAGGPPGLLPTARLSSVRSLRADHGDVLPQMPAFSAYSSAESARRIVCALWGRPGSARGAAR